MNELTVKSFGPIKKGTVQFGDLTLLIGQQASGKSIFVQLLKLLVDKVPIRKTLEQYGYVWSADVNKILDLYFGEGMSGIWKDNAEISLDGKSYSKDFLSPKAGRTKAEEQEEKLFYIPAQRILSIADGRPKTFMEFDNSAPFVLRQFSEALRQLVQNGMEKSEMFFPPKKRLKKSLREAFNESIFHGGKVVIDERSGQKKLRMEVAGMSVPFITWSAGQKEFMPLLLGFYWLCPPSKVSKRDALQFVVIEEPEMGLHPQAIQAVLVQIIDLLSRGYKVVVTSHSPVFLEMAWAVGLLKSNAAKDESLYALFDLPKNNDAKKVLEGLLSKKDIKTYFFKRDDDTVATKDISSLSAFDDDKDVAMWGGFSTFASRASDLVSQTVANAEKI